MKARPFLAAVLTAALVLLGLGAGAWWLVLERSPLALQHQPLALPLAARFVPRSAPLTLHWLVGPEAAGSYARAVAPPRQRRSAAEALDRLRDGAFAAAGLDYASELSPWLGGEVSLALLTPPDQVGEPGWVLALRSRDNEGARRFLQRFWQTRSLAGTDLQVSRYRGMGLISGRGALVGESPRPLATALIHDDLVLIASGRGVLEQALDVSQIDELNQAASPPLRQAVARLGQGVALLTARPAALERWLGLPADPQLISPASELVAALSPSGRGLAVDALVQLRAPLAPRPLVGAEVLQQQLHTPVASLALLQDPATLLGAPEPTPAPAAEAPAFAAAAEGQPLDPVQLADEAPSGVEAEAPVAVAAEDPQPAPEQARPAPAPATLAPTPTSPDAWRALLGPVLARALAAEAGPLPALVAAADRGPLLWARQEEGWLLGTRADSPAPEALQADLTGQGFTAAPLTLQGQTLEAWTQLESRPVRGNPDQLQARLAGARSAQGDLAWWGQGLAVLAQQREGHGQPRRRLEQLQALGTPQAPVQWAMDGATARGLLARWQPWRLLATLASTPLTERLEGGALSLDADVPAAAPASGAAPRVAPAARGALRLHAVLELG